MTETSNLDSFPKTQIKPYDGMPVTAEVWGLAHQEHRMAQQAHDLIFHGAGIIQGLEVQASDPPDQYVFISPGVAVDPAGNVIVLTEPIAYDFGNATEGDLYLLLGNGERELNDGPAEIRMVKKEIMVAARPNLPRRPSVELARVKLTQRGGAIRNAANPAYPQAEEIDLRYRVAVGRGLPQLVRVAVVPLGGALPAGVLEGWSRLAEECKRSTLFQLIVDPISSIAGETHGEHLLYIVGNGAFKLGEAERNNLKNYLNSNRMILVEAFDRASADSFQSLFHDLGVQPAGLSDGHALLCEPYLFNQPPEGNLGNLVQISQGIIYTEARYSLAWNGKIGSNSSRADIRSGHEWGINLIQYCVSQVFTR